MEYDAVTELTFAERMRDEYGITSPEYAAAVYEGMLDGEYERRAATDDRIATLGEHLEREKREIALQRRARTRAAEWQQLDEPTEAELDAPEAPTSEDVWPPRILDDKGDWVAS
jgi:hypothetical protein